MHALSSISNPAHWRARARAFHSCFSELARTRFTNARAPEYCICTFQRICESVCVCVWSWIERAYAQMILLSACVHGVVCGCGIVGIMCTLILLCFHRAPCAGLVHASIWLVHVDKYSKYCTRNSLAP